MFGPDFHDCYNSSNLRYRAAIFRNSCAVDCLLPHNVSTPCYAVPAVWGGVRSQSVSFLRNLMGICPTMSKPKTIRQENWFYTCGFSDVARGMESCNT